MPTALERWDGSYALRLPKDIARKAGLSLGDLVVVRLYDGHIIMIVPTRDAHRHANPPVLPYDELLRGYSGGSGGDLLEWEDDSPRGHGVGTVVVAPCDLDPRRRWGARNVRISRCGHERPFVVREPLRAAEERGPNRPWEAISS